VLAAVAVEQAVEILAQVVVVRVGARVGAIRVASLVVAQARFQLIALLLLFQAW